MATFGSVLGNGEFDRGFGTPTKYGFFRFLAPRVDFTRAGLLIQAVGVLLYAILKVVYLGI